MSLNLCLTFIAFVLSVFKEAVLSARSPVSLPACGITLGMFKLWADDESLEMLPFSSPVCLDSVW